MCVEIENKHSKNIFFSVIYKPYHGENMLLENNWNTFYQKIMILAIVPAGTFNFNLFEYGQNKKVCNFVNSMFNFGVVTVISIATGVPTIGQPLTR